MTDTKTMTGAELKVRLGGLGLPPSWFADMMGVTMRTVVRWFDGAVVPFNAAQAIDKIEDNTLDEMHSIIDKVPHDRPVVLTTYRTDGEVASKHGKYPASWHRALTFRLMEHFEAQGDDVVIEYR